MNFLPTRHVPVNYNLWRWLDYRRHICDLIFILHCEEFREVKQLQINGAERGSEDFHLAVRNLKTKDEEKTKAEVDDGNLPIYGCCNRDH